VFSQDFNSVTPANYDLAQNPNLVSYLPLVGEVYNRFSVTDRDFSKVPLSLFHYYCVAGFWLRKISLNNGM